MSDMTFVVGYVSGVRFYAQAQCYEALKRGMMARECVEFLDVDGEPGCVSGKWLDAIYLSSPESRKTMVAFDKALDDEKENEDPSWK